MFLISAISGILLGRLAFFICLRFFKDKLIVVERCKKGEIVEGYHLINDAIRTFDQQLKVVIMLAVILVVCAPAFIIAGSGIVFGVLYGSIVSITVFCCSFLHFGEFFRYIVERAQVLEGHKIDSRLGRFIYKSYLLRKAKDETDGFR
jgi:hypothetical protein